MEELIPTIIGGLISFISTLIASFAGGGSSLIMFPLFLEITSESYASLLTTTKIGATTMTLTSAKIHSGKNKINKALLATITIFALLGTGIGTYFVQYKPNEELFKTILSTTLIFTAFYILASKNIGIKDSKQRKITPPTLILTAIFSLLLNILNGLFGGTGILLTLFLVIFIGLSFIKAIALSFFSYSIVNIIQTSYLALTEEFNIPFTILVVTGALIGAQIGTKLQYLKGNKWVKFAAISMMLLVGINNSL